MIFPPFELPQYIVVPPTDCEMKDIIGYHNKHLTGKISNQTAIFEKFRFQLSAIYLTRKRNLADHNMWWSALSHRSWSISGKR